MKGRNLAHFGCLIGLILGLSGGILLAWSLILHNVATMIAMGAWMILTVVLGGIGYSMGNYISPKQENNELS
jgi:hypothetical protein